MTSLRFASRQGRGIIILCALAMSCGKETKQTPGSNPPRREPITSEMEGQLARQSLECDSGLSCPAGLAKIVIVDRGRLKTCTGFMVNALTVATTASCLTESLRISAEDPTLCQRDLHVFFARSGFLEPARARCRKLLLVTPLVGKDPVLWRHDLVYVEIEPMARRRSLRMDRSGVKDRETLAMWRVERENDEVSVIRRADCKAVLNSYVNPLSTTGFDPNFVISGCDLRPSYQGAPLLNEAGGWVGTYSLPVDPTIIDFILNQNRMTETLLPVGHVSNAACLPSLVDSNMPARRECGRSLNTDIFDVQRDSQLHDPAVFAGRLRELERLANATRDYLQWKGELVAHPEQGFRIKLVPDCFKNVDAWVSRFGRNPDESEPYTMELPDWQLVMGHDSGLRLAPFILQAPVRRIRVNFSPRAVKRQRLSPVSVAGERYPRVGECPTVAP